MKVRKLPSNFDIPLPLRQYGIMRYNRDLYEDIRMHHEDLIREDVGSNAYGLYGLDTIILAKLRMLGQVKDYLKGEGIDFDEFAGLAPTRLNAYKSYEFAAVWVWSQIIFFTKDREMPSDAWYRKYGPCVASVMRKYPKITGILIMQADLKIPGNRLLDVAKMEDADFDNDHTDEVLTDEKAEAFKAWILKWCSDATEKDKLRVRNWFETKKSHKQIFAEINKVVGNSLKFNARLALFVERLFNQEGLDYFFEKSGFATKEDLFMAYFDKLTQFDEETKKSFIKKYLLG